MTPTQTTPAASPKGKGPAAKQAQPVSRRARKKERTRQRIYEAAMALFSERGFDDVTIEEICEAADIAKATFFLHFPTKASLVFENTARMTERLREEFVEPGESARADLERMSHLMLAHWSENGEVMAAMLRELFSGPVAEIADRPENEEFIEFYTEIFRRGQRHGEFRKDVLPEIAAASFFATCSTLAAIQVRKVPEMELAPLVDQYMSMVFDGLVTRDRKAAGKSAKKPRK